MGHDSAFRSPRCMQFVQSPEYLEATCQDGEIRVAVHADQKAGEESA